MTSLLAMLLSMALLLTGVPADAALDAPVGNVVTIGNLVVSKNDDTVALNAYATFGLSTDGQEALFDFSVINDEQVYLPCQAAVTADRLLLNAGGQTLSMTGAELEQFFKDAGFTSEDDGTAAIMDVYFNKMVPAYIDLMRLMRDEEQMAALKARSWEIYDEVIDRGEGTPGKVEYEGETYDVTDYDYTLTAADLTALTEAICKESEVTSNYLAAYDELIASLPEEAGLKGADSYAALMANMDMSMRMSESIAENGLDIMDGMMSMNVPQFEQPMNCIIHQTRFGAVEASTVQYRFDIEENSVEFYMEYSNDGQDAHASVNITVNPSAETRSTEDESEEPVPEGDEADAVYITFDYNLTRDPDLGGANENFSVTADIAESDSHLDFGVDAQSDAEGVASAHFDISVNVADDTAGASFDVLVTKDTVEKRVSDEGAVNLENYNVNAAGASIMADCLKLYADPNFQALAAMLTAPLDDVTVIDLQPDGTKPEADAGDLPFGNPDFTWLPEGYAVGDIDVQAEYEYMSVNLANAATGGSIFVELHTPYSFSPSNYYVIKDDGFKEVDGMLVTETTENDYRIYTAEKGEVSINIFPEDDSITAIDVLNIIIGLQF